MGDTSYSQSSENIYNYVIQLEEDKCNIVKVISSDDEYTYNGVCNVAFLLKNGTL